MESRGPDRTADRRNALPDRVNEEREESKESQEEEQAVQER